MAGLADKFNDIKEQKYASQAKEPLGHSYQRNYNWPGRVEDPTKYPFGVPTIGSESAKDVLYPVGGAMEEHPKIA